MREQKERKIGIETNIVTFYETRKKHFLILDPDNSVDVSVKDAVMISNIRFSLVAMIALGI